MDPCFRAELILPTTLRVETYTHLSVEMLDEEMTKVVGFGTMDFFKTTSKIKGKYPGNGSRCGTTREKTSSGTCAFE